MKSIALFLLLTVAALVGQDETCKTPIEEYQPSVESMLKLPEGMSVSWLDKYVGRLGDDAAVVLIRGGAPVNLRNPSDVRKALHVLHVAFECPACLEHKEGRTAGVTMLLLRTLETMSDDAQLKRQIAETRDYISNQLREGETESAEPSVPCNVKGELASQNRKTIWFTSDEMKARATKKIDVGGILKNADVNATVIASVVVNTDGSVECLKIINPKHPMVVEEVDQALRQWKFKPIEQDGKPVSYVGWLQFQFCRIGCAEGKSSVTLLK